MSPINEKATLLDTKPTCAITEPQPGPSNNN
jgi:hypothetical protein